MKLRKNRRTKWTEEERKKLKILFGKFDGEISKISRELRRGERSVRMNLFFMGLISEDDVDKNLVQCVKNYNQCPKTITHLKSHNTTFFGVRRTEYRNNKDTTVFLTTHSSNDYWSFVTTYSTKFCKGTIRELLVLPEQLKQVMFSYSSEYHRIGRCLQISI